MPRESDMNIERGRPERPTEFELPEIETGELLPGVMKGAKKGLAGGGKERGGIRKSEKAGKKEKKISAKEQLDVYLSMPPGEARNRVLGGFLERRGDSLGLDDLTRAAKSFNEEPEVTATPIAPRIEQPMLPVEPKDGGERLAEGRYERIAQIRGKIIDYINENRGTPSLITFNAVQKAVNFGYGYTSGANMVPKDYLYDLSPEDKKYVGPALEREIKARCELVLAQQEEDGFRLNTKQDFGSSSQRYVDALTAVERGGHGVAVITQDTLDFFSGLGRDTGKFTDNKDKVFRENIAFSLQVMTQLGEVDNEIRRAIAKKDKGGRSEDWDKYFEFFKGEDGDLMDGDGYVVDKDGKKIGKLKTGKSDELKAKYPALSGKIDGHPTVLVDFSKLTTDNKSKLLPSYGLNNQDNLLNSLKNIVGHDAVDLASQLFDGLRMEGLYFSGSTLGQLRHFAESRNFLAIFFHSFYGSTRGQIAVYRKEVMVGKKGHEKSRYGVWIDPSKQPDEVGYVVPEADVAMEGLYGYEKDDPDYRKEVLVKDTKEVRVIYGVRVNKDDRSDKESIKEVTDGDFFPLKKAFMQEGDLEDLGICPVSVKFKHNDVVKSWYLEWLRDGTFFDNINKSEVVDAHRKKRTLEIMNLSNVKAALEYRIATRNIGKVGGSEDKTTPENAPTLLTALLGQWIVLIQAGGVRKDDFVRQLGREKINLLWNKNPLNSTATSGTQALEALRFWTPSQFNDYMKSLVVTPGVVNLFSDTDMSRERLDRMLALDPFTLLKTYAEYVDDLRDASMNKIKGLRERGNEKDTEFVDKQKAAMDLNLPTEVGGMLLPRALAKLRAEQQEAINRANRIRRGLGLGPAKK